MWDLRMRKTLHNYKLPAGAGRLAFSQRGLLAATVGNIVEVRAKKIVDIFSSGALSQSVLCHKDHKKILECM